MKDTQLPLSEFTQRRQRFFEQMADESVAIFSANKEVTRSNDTEYPFCQNKNFYYLTGFNEPDAILILIKTKTPQAILFCLAKDPTRRSLAWEKSRRG